MQVQNPDRDLTAFKEGKENQTLFGQQSFFLPKQTKGFKETFLFFQNFYFLA